MYQYLARRYDLPVWATHGTLRSMRDNDLPRAIPIDGHTPFCIEEVRVVPFPVPHDAAEPCQFVFASAGVRLGILTDTGDITPTQIVTGLQEGSFTEVVSGLEGDELVIVNVDN